MDNIQRYELKQNKNGDEYELLLYVDESLAEFADELGSEPKARTDFLETAKQIVKERYPKLRVSVVKIICGGIVVTAIPFTLHVNKIQAASQTPITTQANVSSLIYYEVTAKDTLWNIARKYNTTVDLMKKANQLTTDTLQLNQRLIIPKAIHLVGSGDYLSVLAKNYDTTVDAIKEANKLTSDATKIGQTLIIPVLLNNIGESRVQTGTTEQPAPTQGANYTVIPGDTLYSIGKRFQVSVDQLVSTNDLTSIALQIGQVLTIPTTSTANPPSPSNTNTPLEQTKIHTVVVGDTLYSIARKNNVTVDTLREVNQLNTNVLGIGQVLTIPSYIGETETEKPTERSSTYTVVAGDNLWTITQRLGLTVADLRAANQLTTDSLQIGQKLTIPPKSEAKTDPVPVLDEVRTTFTCMVRSGDSLSVIANRFDITVDQLRTANQLNSDVLQIGQVLTIPNGLNEPSTTTNNTITYQTHTVASGDNIWGLSIRYGIPQHELLKANNLTTSSALSIGQTLKIPMHNIAVKPVVSEKHGEYLDWWTEAQYVFTIGKTAKVTDFATGKSFFIKRTIGANHADSETVTANDSTIAQSIWGGYSWTPRAVILEVDGRKIAASMSFMPHEREYITNNGITGHFDVYFGNSTRHIDGKADPSHQAQVEKAAGLQ
ncbi:LysM repeat protein [Salirhabdus euzebyi]|uniref:LysM repeat protein n=1 Tax=Salirhabdus euzebyi TaxID=394506 RepID=A0A841PXR3_9BACI|nr:LysM peptidoglycan-binding domain-containing protein [Salirhabdus euzebyi]MBB6452286.1 LysM repeat protein [Salirhabdus euzebyi]